eukprot:gnl/TRDRNA2_/TRDRNA2_38978_c0_seq2.p1 gnl/TRDRNA2_/TRDRNA2_38978_c0~~gnl/TRDRNA2_/TRDRNA2_38978_c0_seq2.p1  ORF type:complete len:247 (-),score=3.53 gnl/TRDRNA2_/TRDRNA2_38978_c0_seq2:115-855(-)
MKPSSLLVFATVILFPGMRAKEDAQLKKDSHSPGTQGFSLPKTFNFSRVFLNIPFNFSVSVFQNDHRASELSPDQKPGALSPWWHRSGALVMAGAAGWHLGAEGACQGAKTAVSLFTESIRKEPVALQIVLSIAVVPVMFVVGSAVGASSGLLLGGLFGLPVGALTGSALGHGLRAIRKALASTTNAKSQGSEAGENARTLVETSGYPADQLFILAGLIVYVMVAGVVVVCRRRSSTIRTQPLLGA